MENTNDRNKHEAKIDFKTKIMLEGHLNIIYLLGLISPENKEHIAKLLIDAENMDNAGEIVSYIVDIYDIILDSKNVTDTNKDILLARTLLERIKDTLYRKNGRITLNLLEMSANLLRTLDVKKSFFRNEVVFNIESIREKFKTSMVLDSENITVILAMLDQLKLAEYL